MGLLMPVSLPPRALLAFLVLAAATVPSCSGLRLGYPLRALETDVPMFAGNPLRNNNPPNVPPPPLVPTWEQDVTAGIGDGAPVLVDSVLFVGNLRGELYAFHAHTGKRLGWVTLGGAIHGSPVIDGNLAIVPVSGSRETLIAYDLAEGKARWRQTIGDVHGSPLLLHDRVFVGTTLGVMYSFARTDGEQLWDYAIPGNTTLKGIRSSPAGAGDAIVFGADDGALYHLHAASGALVWRTQTDGAIQATPAIYEDRVYVGSLGGSVYAVDLDSGSILWRVAAGSAVYGAFLVDTTAAIVGTTGGKILALHPSTGTVLWESNIGAPVNCGALGAGPYIYVGTLKKDLIALDRRSGAVVWRTLVGGRIKTTPIAGSGRVFVAGDDRIVLGFRSDTR